MKSVRQILVSKSYLEVRFLGNGIKRADLFNRSSNKKKKEAIRQTSILNMYV